MNQLLLLHGNPRRKGRKHRTAAQKAATRRMLAANRARRNPKRRRRPAAASPVVTRARRTIRRARRAVHRSARRFSGARLGFRPNQIMALAKGAAIGAGGALLTDVAMGYASGVLPASMASRVNTDGSTNWLYFATKGAVAIALGVFGGKVIGQATAARMGEGALTVMAYEILRGLMPSGITLGGMGYYNAAPMVNGMGRQLPNNMGAVLTLPTNRGTATAMAHGALGAGRMSNRNR